MEGLSLILDDLKQGKISVDDAEQQIIDLFDDNYTSNDCNCCYMTLGVHSTSCPQHVND